MTDRRRIGIVLFDDVEELDAVGPWEVLAAWTKLSPADGYEVVCASWDGSSVGCAKGLRLAAHTDFAALGPLDVLVHPGGIGTRRLIVDDGHLAWVRHWRATTPLLASVCTGSLVFAAAGLLAGRPATTHGNAVHLLGDLDPSIDVRVDERFVDDGDVVTSAGVSAGIDMALHLVARLAGRDRAMEIRRYIEYDPAPPV